MEIIQLTDPKAETNFVPGTQTAINMPRLLSFASVSVRDRDVYRCSPEIGFGFCKHTPEGKTIYLGGYPSIAPPILLQKNGIYGGLDGALYVVELSGSRKIWSFKTAFGKAISAPIAVCDGRMYTHTAEGQIFAVEQETGRLLWRRYWPGVHISFTSPIYYKKRLLVPQAGMKKSRMRCLDAATGKLLWEAPFTGSPSWSRQQPPVIYNNLAIYSFGTGRYAAQETEKAYVQKGTPIKAPEAVEIMSWIYSHNNPYYPKDQRPLVRAWDLDTGKEVWTVDFSQFGSGGNDSGVCLMDGTIYYSTFFGYAARTKEGHPKAQGLTAAIEPTTGRVIWQTTRYSVTAGCTISGKDGRLYMGGYNRPNEKTNDRHVWCLDARDGSLIWQSEPLSGAVNGVGISERFIFAHARAKNSYQLNKDTGKILSNFSKGYSCTRFTFSEPYIIGCNMDMIDSSNGNKLVSSGPCVDVRECVGAVVSNGRMFYTSQGSGLQVCQVYGAEARSFTAPWTD